MKKQLQDHHQNTETANCNILSFLFLYLLFASFFTLRPLVFLVIYISSSCTFASSKVYAFKIYSFFTCNQTGKVLLKSMFILFQITVHVSVIVLSCSKAHFLLLHKFGILKEMKVPLD